MLGSSFFHLALKPTRKCVDSSNGKFHVDELQILTEPVEDSTAIGLGEEQHRRTIDELAYIPHILCGTYLSTVVKSSRWKTSPDLGTIVITICLKQS